VKQVAALLILCAVCTACSGTATPVSPSTSTSPTPFATSSFTGESTMTFDGLSGLPCGGRMPGPAFSPNCVVNSYSESGFTVNAIAASWSVRTDLRTSGAIHRILCALCRDTLRNAANAGHWPTSSYGWRSAIQFQVR